MQELTGPCIENVSLVAGMKSPWDYSTILPPISSTGLELHGNALRNIGSAVLEGSARNHVRIEVSYVSRRAEKEKLRGWAVAVGLQILGSSRDTLGPEFRRIHATSTSFLIIELEDGKVY